MQPAIQLQALVKDYGRTRALAGLDLTVERGQIFGFLGPNGAGKTTTIRIMLDLIRPTAGTARILGLDSIRESIAIRQRSGYLPGDLRLYESMTGAAFLDLIDAFRPDKRDRRYRSQLIDRLGLNDTITIRALSKGNRQKLGLVQAMMHRPELLILDEPTSGLDPLVQNAVASLLEDAVAGGCTVFFSSHVLSEVERLSHSVAIIRRGRIVAVEDVGKLKSRSVHVVEVTFALPPPARIFDTIAGVEVLRHDGPTFRLQARQGIDALLKTIARYTVIDLRTEQPSLEDAFMEYYAGAEEQQERSDAAS